MDEDKDATEAMTDEELQELKDYKNKYLQLLADSDNARRRLQKEREEIVSWALQGLLLDVLDPIDHMENALQFIDQASEEVQKWSVGFNMILTQFRDVLVNQGIKPIDAMHKPFDPNIMEAIEMIETDEHEPGIVVEVSMKGYILGEKTLRPAKVKVSKQKEKNNEQEEK